ncbi:hypothetical protein T05_4122 [Trichinella murrelli]|uniref:Uncharacterized protein n=1 Tax=Trichinella murrelli TaxID=144512 RepID=A0A0V0TB13_9BILA|nr:hypothetical protein T05_4122 [Trichinella murrelli]
MNMNTINNNNLHNVKFLLCRSCMKGYLDGKQTSGKANRIYKEAYLLVRDHSVITSFRGVNCFLGHYV